MIDNYLIALFEKIYFKEYFLIGKYKEKIVVVFKDDLTKGFWKPKILE